MCKIYLCFSMLFVCCNAFAIRVPTTQYLSDILKRTCHNPDLRFDNVGKNFIPSEHYVLEAIDALNEFSTDYANDARHNIIASTEYIKNIMGKLNYTGDCSFCAKGFERYPVSHIVIPDDNEQCSIGTKITDIDITECKPSLDDLGWSCQYGYWVGKFVVGSGCVGANCTTTKYTGEGRCTSANILPSDKFGATGAYCFCRITGIADKNGIIQPHNGVWGFRKSYTYSSSACPTYCAEDCGWYFVNRPAFRRALLSPIPK